MGIEVDFLAVGEKSRSGDAIAFRYGNLHGSRNEQVVAVIDGGTVDSGEQLLAHIWRYYGTDYVDYAFLSHPDNDHSKGARVLVENLGIGTLLMHLPWDHVADIRSTFKNRQLTTTGLRTRMEKSLEAAAEIQEIAETRRIDIEQPFRGWKSLDGGLLILGPSEAYYQTLLPHFRDMPEPKKRAFVEGKTLSLTDQSIRETWDFRTETLEDPNPDPVSAANNSCVVLYLAFGGQKVLFTADAGVSSLTRAANYAERVGLDLSDLSLLQVPHHGSRRNLGPSVLDRIKSSISVISAAADGSPKHPSKRVINALLRRGSAVYVTAGTNLWYHVGAPDRGWGMADPHKFSFEVESLDKDDD